MQQAKWTMAVAAALLTAGVGCSLAEVRGFFWLSPEAEAAGEYFIAQTVDEAALMVELALNRLGLKAIQTPQGNGVVLDSATRKGSKFRIFITTEPDRRTRLRVEWIGAPDRDVQTLVIGGMQATLLPAHKK